MTTSKSLRFALMLALAAACGAPDVPQSPPPPPTTSAVFDPLTGNIPLPNDLALAQIPSTLPPAQQDLLKAFAAQGGFPNDQEVPVTVSFQTTTVAADGTTTNAAPDLDLASLNPPNTNLVVFLATPQGAGTAPIDSVQAADYVKGSDRGTLTLHHKGRTPWPPGQYVLALRGGPNGVKTTTGAPVVASPTFFLIAQGEKLDTEQNLALLRAQTGSTAAAKAAAAQLQAIIANYSCGPGDTACLAAGGKSPPEPGSAFAAVDQVFPHQQAAVMTTFRVAPVAGTQVQLDAGRGLLPLPIDLLRDPRPASASCAACGHITAQAACALASGNFNAATGACTDAKGKPSDAAAGIQTLDGFSTTGPIIAQVSDLIVASTVTASTVQLWDLTNPATPVKVDATTYLTEPVEVVQSGLSNAIVLQPAGATASDPTSVFRTRPLKENTDYAVIISDGVKDKTGKSLAAGTVAKILQFTHPTVDAQGNSQLAGIDNATAGALEIMRQKLAPALQASAFGQGHIAMAYTFKTQSFLLTAAQLGALPYTTPVTTVAPLATPTLYCGTAAGAIANPACATAPTVASAFSRYGMSPALPQANVGFIVEATVPTFNKLQCNAGDATCTDTGAFTPATVQPVAEGIVALVAVPPPPYPVAGGTPCTPNPAASPPVLCTIPLAVFHHGLGRGRGDMLAIADTLNKAGIAVASIDAAKHGDRSFCKADAECATGAHCVPEPALANEGDAPGPTPGLCRTGTTPTSPRADFKRSAACPSPACTNESAVPVASSNFLIGTNFFRTRDTQRQDIIDQSQLVRVLSPNPACQLGAAPTDAAHTCANRVLPISLGVQIDPGQIWFVGQSLGSIEGMVDVASNPRFNEAAFNVGGGTIVDVFTTSPAFASATNQLLQAIGIQPGTPQFLQFLVVAKTILDPADPVNYAPHLTRDPLPNLLRDPTGKTPQATKDIFTQIAFCDQVVPNPWNFILDTTAHTGPSPADQGFGGPGNLQLYAKGTSVPDLTACPAPTSGLPPPASAVSHGFLLDFADPAITATAQDYISQFLLSSTGTVDKSLVVLP